MKRVGVFGGSFNPVHSGHLILADQVREMAGLDEVIFVPAYISPYKLDEPPLPGDQRIKMIELATHYCDYFYASDIEIKRKGPSYTYDTLNALQEQFGDDVRLYFILGSDALMGISGWKNSADLINKYGLVGVYRKGDNKSEIDLKILKLIHTHKNADIKIYETPDLEISSREIRDKLKLGGNIKFFTPGVVIDYIRENNLFDSQMRRLSLFVRNNVEPERYAHSVRVVKKAREYGQRYGVDIEKLEIAAIFHDAYKNVGGLEHGYVAAEHLEKDFGITDPEILDAVKYHSTGHAGAGKVEMVLKMADILEDGRDFIEASILREKMSDDLEKSMLLLMQSVKNFVLRADDQVFDKKSEEFIEWLEERIRERND